MSEDPTKYVTGATDADVVRLMGQAQALASAGTMNLTPRDQSGDTTLYGEFRITNKNPFKKYAELSVISPHTTVPLIKLGLGTVSGLKLEVVEGKGNDQLLEKMNDWAEHITLSNKVQNITRCTVRDGTALISLGREVAKKTNDTTIDLPAESITAIDILPMQYMTLLTESESRSETNTDHLIKGLPDRAILHEAKKTVKKGMVMFEREEFAMFRLFNEGYFMEDILGRETFGIYGLSLIEPITRPLKDLMDLNAGFGAYMRRYGIDRLNVNLPIVDQLRQEERYAEAKTILEDTIASMQKLGAHEDMVSGGADVKSISGGTVPTVRDMKESHENDISIGLLQNPLVMGKASGTTYASGYLAEADRATILESIQNLILQTVQKEIINPQIKAYGGQLGAIKITANDLTNPIISTAELTDARINGDIVESEWRTRAGFPAEKPTE